MDCTALLYEMSVNFLHDDLKVGETVRLRSPVVLGTKLSINFGSIKEINEGRRGKTYNVYIGHEQKDLREVVRSRLWKVTDLDNEKNEDNEGRSPSKKSKKDGSNHNPVKAPLTPSIKDDDANHTQANGSRRKPVEQLHAVTEEVLRTYPSGTDAAEYMKIAQGGISLCCNGKQQEFCGYRWRFYAGSSITDFEELNAAQLGYDAIINLSYKGPVKAVYTESPGRSQASSEPNSRTIVDGSTDRERSFKVESVGSKGSSQTANQAGTIGWPLPSVASESRGSSSYSEYMPDMWFSTYSSLNATKTAGARALDSPQDVAIRAPEYIDTVRNDEVEASEKDHTDEGTGDFTFSPNLVAIKPSPFKKSIGGQKRKQDHEGGNGSKSREIEENETVDASPKASRAVSIQENADAVDDQDRVDGSSNDSSDSGGDGGSDSDSDSGSDSDRLNCLTGTIEVGEKVELKAPPGAHDKYGVVKKIIDGRRSVNYLMRTKTTSQVLARERFWKVSNTKNTRKVTSTTTSSSNNSNRGHDKHNSSIAGALPVMSAMRKQQLMLRQSMK